MNSLKCSKEITMIELTIIIALAIAAIVVVARDVFKQTKDK